MCASLSEKTEKILREFLRFYEDQYGVSLFNSMRHEIEGTGPPQAQLLWRKVRGTERVQPGLCHPFSYEAFDVASLGLSFPLLLGWSLRALH